MNGVGRVRDRTTGEILILTITFTVCFGVVASGALVALIAYQNPQHVDIQVWVARISGILNTMLGLLAGFLAGHADSTRKSGPPPEE